LRWDSLTEMAERLFKKMSFKYGCESPVVGVLTGFACEMPSGSCIQPQPLPNLSCLICEIIILKSGYKDKFKEIIWPTYEDCH
jgi:hypothetical protein